MLKIENYDKVKFLLNNEPTVENTTSVTVVAVDKKAGLVRVSMSSLEGTEVGLKIDTTDRKVGDTLKINPETGEIAEVIPAKTTAQASPKPSSSSGQKRGRGCLDRTHLSF